MKQAPYTGSVLEKYSALLPSSLTTHRPTISWHLHLCTKNTFNAEAGGFWVQGQPRLSIENLSPFSFPHKKHFYLNQSSEHAQTIVLPEYLQVRNTSLTAKRPRVATHCSRGLGYSREQNKLKYLLHGYYMKWGKEWVEDKSSRWG